MRAGPSLAHLKLYWEELCSAKIAKTSPWNMPALKFILAAAAWGKVKANMTTTGKSWHFSELEAHGFHINIKHQHDRIENFILLINTNSSSGELGVD